MTANPPIHPSTRIALVGDRSPHVRSHVRIPGLLDALREHERLDLDPYWIPTDEVGSLDGFDGIWLLPGSPYRSMDGGLAAARAARTHAIPYLGTCGGFQHAVLEFARDVCGLAAAQHAEYDAEHRAEDTPDADQPVIVPLACSLAGHEAAVRIAPGSLAEQILGAERTVERYHCAYGLDRAYVDLLTRHGLRFSGHDEEGEVRIAELADHPFFLATLFQPELATAARPHPVIRAFAVAATAHAVVRTAAPV
jgi:CTP synthase (UTP-ammonia lyase)